MSKKFKTGKVELPEDAFDNARVRISIMVPTDVLEAFKKEAKKRNTAYQTLINDVLRANAKHFTSGPDDFILRADEIEKLAEQLKELSFVKAVEDDEKEEKLA